MLISYYANKKSSPRLPSWQPSLIFFNIHIESGTIIKPCTLKHFWVTYMLHKAGYWTNRQCRYCRFNMPLINISPPYPIYTCKQIFLFNFDALAQASDFHYADVIMIEITSLMVVYSIVNSGADQSKHQNSASLAFVWGIHRDRWIPRTKGQ